MRRQLFYVKQRESMGGEHRLRAEKREVGKMLMVNRVELVLLDEPHEVREFDGDGAKRLQQDLEAGDEVIEVVHLGEDVFPQQEIGLLPLLRQPGREICAEELRQRGYTVGE